MWVAAGMAAVSMASSMFGQKAAAKAADRARAQEMAGATAQFASSEASINLMKALGRETTLNAINEATRAGAAGNQDVRDKVEQVKSTAQASSEGLTSGRSAGRQMIAIQVEGNKLLQDSKSDTSKMMIQMVDVQNKKNSELNQKLFNNYQEMATVLTTPGAIYQGSVLEVVSAGISGAQAGASLGSAMSAAGSSSAAAGASADNTLYSGGADWGTNGKF